MLQIVRYTGRNGDRYKSERGPFSQVKSPKFGRDRKSVHKFQEAPDAKLRLNALGKVKPGWVPKTPAREDLIRLGPIISIWEAGGFVNPEEHESVSPQRSVIGPATPPGGD